MRSIWKGHIRFLLVAIPVRVYNAIEASEKIQFNQLHREDFGPIGYDKRCKKCGQVVTNDEITKGYQYEADRYYGPSHLPLVREERAQFCVLANIPALRQATNNALTAELVPSCHEGLSG